MAYFAGMERLTIYGPGDLIAGKADSEALARVWCSLLADREAEIEAALEDEDTAAAERIWQEVEEAARAAVKVETPTIEVLGLGSDDWTEEADGEEREEAADAREWERYGTVRVRIDDTTYEVGAVVGVPEYLRGTARAAGGDTVTPYLDAWYADASDYIGAGVPSDLADEVLAAIRGEVRRLWAEYQAELAGE